MDIAKFLNGEPEGTWYTVQDEDGSETNVRVKIRGMKPKKKRDLDRICTRRRVKNGVVYEDKDADKLHRLCLLHCVVDWENIEKNDAPFPVSDENKVVLNDNWTEFSDLWTSVFARELEVAETIKEAEIKN